MEEDDAATATKADRVEGADSHLDVNTHLAVRQANRHITVLANATAWVLRDVNKHRLLGERLNHNVVAVRSRFFISDQFWGGFFTPASE